MPSTRQSGGLSGLDGEKALLWYTRGMDDPAPAHWREPVNPQARPTVYAVKGITNDPDQFGR